SGCFGVGFVFPLGPPPPPTAAAISPGMAMTRVSGAVVARRVGAQPWISGVTVIRRWPATVVIRVTERRPAAVARDDARTWAVVDATGRVLEQVDRLPEGLPVIEGVPAAGAPGTVLGPPASDPLRVATSLPRGLAPRVASVMRAGSDVELRLRPAGVVLLGSLAGLQAGGIDQKLQAALTVLATVDGRVVATLDVRIPATPVLTRG
ncbi:MAG: cell division protein FtsQ/DivIB, partial [Acidimicrobiales bacterium]